MATAYLAGVGFAATFLLTSVFGQDGATALIRGCVVAVLCVLLGAPLCRLVVSAVLDAMARDRAARAAETEDDA